MMTRDTLDALRQFDTPTIANAIELFEVRPCNQGFMDGRIGAMFPDLPPAVGFAATASFRSDAPPVGGDAYGDLLRQVEVFEELPGPPMVVFQDLDDPPVGATFGEVMCSVYKAFGAVGLVTSGGGRDLEQVRKLGFPVFAGSTICAHGYCHMLHLGLPVRVGGLTVRQGELLHGDANGVLAVPREIASELPGVASEFVAAERIILDYVQSEGEKTTAGLRQVHREFAAAIDRLKRSIHGC